MTVTLTLREVTAADPTRDRVPAELYDVMARGETVGTVHLRLGNTDHLRLYGGQVGYEIDPTHRGNGYASEALAALRPIARRHGFSEIWITCRPDNIASCRTLEKAGAHYEGTVATPAGSDLHARGDLAMRRYRLAV